METNNIHSNVNAATRFVGVGAQRYAYRRFGAGSGLPVLFLQHFMGTMDNWDPAVTDPIARNREVLLFDNAGIGRSSGSVPVKISDMAAHALTFLDRLGIETCDVLGFSLGGMVAQQMALERPSIFSRMVLVGTAPRGGEDIMHLDKPSLAKPLGDRSLKGYTVLQRLFFPPTETAQLAGAAFVDRLNQRQEDREPASGPPIAQAQITAFREWEQVTGTRFADLQHIRHPALIVNGIHDVMIPVRNSYWLGENLPNAVLLTYPDSGHGSLFQFPDAFSRQALAFLDSTSKFAPY